MCKPLDTSMCLEAIRLVKKSGGKSGTVVLE
jgi:molybdenum cofactor biosynthesis enzyme